MSRDNVDRLVVQMEATLRKFERQMEQGRKVGVNTAQQIERRMVTMDRKIQSVTARMAKNLKGALAVGAPVAVLASLTRSVQTAIRSMAQLGAEAERAGVGVEAFQEWSFVAQQNRIGIDALVDSLKELNLRADEFIVTGKGPAAEAFERLGFNARELSDALQDPSELMVEIVDRMQRLERAAQIRVADEVFGGTGGEQFVQLLDQGADGIRRTMAQARDAGAVIDAEMIQRAEELDRKFAEVTTRVSTFFKQVVVGAADATGALDSVQDKLDQMFERTGGAGAILGAEITGGLSLDNRALETHGETLDALRRTYEDLVAEAAGWAARVGQISDRVGDLGYDQTAADLAEVSAKMQDLLSAFEVGTIDARFFEDQLTELTGAAGAALAEIDDIDRARFDGIGQSLGGFIDRLDQAVERARKLRRSLPGAALDGGTEGGAGGGRGSDPRGRGGSAADWQRATATENAPRTSPRPRAAPLDIDFGVPEPTAAGGGGAAQLSDYQRLVQDTRAEIRQLEAEAVELLVVAESGREYGDALEYARRKAELLHDAQAAGQEITPQLRAEIDQLAQAYVEAGQKADAAADRLQEMDETARRGAERMADLFGSIVDGAASAEEALERLLMELSRVQLERQLLAAAEAAGGDSLGALLAGTRAKGGGVRAGSAYLVNENTPRSEVFVPSHSGAVLTVPQAQAALRGRAGQGHANVTVRTTHVVENYSSQVGVKQQRGTDGNMRTIIFDLMDQYLLSGRGDRAQGQRYGIRPIPLGR